MKTEAALRAALRQGATMELRGVPVPAPAPRADPEEMDAISRQLDAALEALARQEAAARALKQELVARTAPKPAVPWTLDVRRDHNENISRVIATSSRGAWEFIPERNRDGLLTTVNARPLTE